MVGLILQRLAAAIYRCRGSPIRLAVLSLLQNVLLLFGLAIIVFAAPTTSAVLLALCASQAIAPVLVLVSHRFDWCCPKKLQLDQMLKFGLREHLGVMCQKMNLKLDILVMSAIGISVSSIGAYSMAAFFVQLVWLVPDSLAVFLLPRLAAERNVDIAVADTTRATRTSLSACVVCSISLALFLPAIPLVLGEQFRPSIAYALILLPGVLALVLAKVISKYFTAMGTPTINSMCAVSGLALNVPLLAILVPTLGAMGAAAASSVSYCLTAALLVRRFLLASDHTVSLKTLLLPYPSDYRLLYQALTFR